MGDAITGTPRFEMRGIRKAFGATVAVDGVDVSVLPGEVCAIVGQNGAGKSTLMAILSGALQPDAGCMTLDGAPYRAVAPARRPQGGRGDDLPGALARAAPERCREHPARHGAGALRTPPARRDAADGDRRARPPRPSGDLDRRGRRHALTRRSATGRDWPRARCRMPSARARRADEQPVARRHRTALRAHRRVEAHGPRDRLHLPLHRRSERSCRPDCRFA